MFDFVATHKKLILIVLLVLIVPPFALFGIDSYFSGREVTQAVARVGDQAISQDEYTRALRDQQQALQRLAKGAIDPGALDSPELRQSTLETLVQRRLLLERAVRLGVVVSDEQLKSMISEQTMFHDEKGQFSYARYEQFARNEGMTPAQFESRLRQGLLIQRYGSGFNTTAFVPRTVAAEVARISEQQREVSQHVIEPARFLSQVKLDPAAVKAYYDTNPGEFRVAEQVQVEYLTLSVDLLAGHVQVDPAEVRKAYDANLAQFGAPESRQASHILISAGSGPEARKKAAAKAEQLYKELVKKPAGFAEAAKKHSQDPGSAANGGDLGRISRGQMQDAPEFEAALFKLKPGEISPPVETKHGFHIIQLVALHGAQTRPFEEVRGQIEGDLRKQQAARRFAEMADQFNNVVYEQSETLKPAADLIKSAPQASGWITRSHAAEPLLNHPRLLSAIFSEEAIKNKRNTEAVEVAPGTLVAARVVGHKAAAMQPFEEVRAAIEKRLALREAGRLAATEGRRLLGELKQGKSVPVAWSSPVVASRADRKDLPEPVVRQVFRMDVSKLPAYSSVETLSGEYFLLRITRVQEADSIPAERAKTLAGELQQVLGQETLLAYVASLRKRLGVSINKAALEKKQ